MTFSILGMKAAGKAAGKIELTGKGRGARWKVALEVASGQDVSGIKTAVTLHESSGAIAEFMRRGRR